MHGHKQSAKWKINLHIKEQRMNMKVTSNEVSRDVFVYRMFGFVCYRDADAHVQQPQFAYREGAEVMLTEKDSAELEFSEGTMQEIRVRMDDESIAKKQLLRIGFYAMTDVGYVLVSFYPTIEAFARPLIMFFSNKKSEIAMAQHMSAAWLESMFVQQK